jgi:hypothetical protein
VYNKFTPHRSKPREKCGLKEYQAVIICHHLSSEDRQWSSVVNQMCVSLYSAIRSYTQLHSADIQEYARSIQKIVSYTQKHVSGIHRFSLKSFFLNHLTTNPPEADE